MAQGIWPRAFPIVQFPNAPLIVAFLAGAAAARTHDPGHALSDSGLARRPSSTLAPGPQRQGYLTVPPEALIAYHVPPNVLAPT